MTNTVDTYTFNTKELPHEETPELQPGYSAGVHFTLSNPDKLEAVLKRIENWYDGCDEVILVDCGRTGANKGFIIMEWEGCEIDPPFIAVLKNTKLVEDYSMYTRDSEV